MSIRHWRGKLAGMQGEPISENKALIRRWFEEVWNQGREDLIDELRAPDTIATGLAEGGGPAQGSAPFKVFFSNLRGTLPDLHVIVEDMLAEGDRVAVRYSIEGTHYGDAMGVAPTGQRVRFSGISIARIAGGKIAESWNNLDQLALLTQIGAIPTNEGGNRFVARR
jgi:predicted ester cyclase